MVNIEIDGKTYSVSEDNNLLQTCLSLGLDLPYFCWHPAMGSVGACRQCAVFQYKDSEAPEKNDTSEQPGRLVMGCMTPVAEGIRISINDKRAKNFRAQVIEYLMVNHPHDCPVCEEGGECHLQDMTLMSGHTERRYQGKKRTHINQYLGPFISHEMNRCIACYRCERFYQDYAGGHDLQAMAAHHHVYFGRHEDGVLESEFSGNLVEVCPTGVFTDKPLGKHYTRKWDLQAAPSVCVHCAIGCNTSPGERYGELRRIVNRYHSEVNGYFLCDRGRFGYDFVNAANRVKHAIRNQRNDQGKQPEKQGNELSRAETRDQLALLLAADKRLLGIGSPRATLEANFALRELVGEANFYTGMGVQEAKLQQLTLDIVRHRPVRIVTLKQVEQADAVLVLGEDILNTSPLLALSLRQTAANISKTIAEKLHVPLWQDAAIRKARQGKKTPIYIASITTTGIDDIAAETFHGTPAAIAKLGAAIAHAIDTAAPVIEGLSEQEIALTQRIADTLKGAQKPLIISGTGCFSVTVLQASANIANALAGRERQDNSPPESDSKEDKSQQNEPHSGCTDVYLCVSESNSMGVALLHDESAHGGSIRDALARIEAGEVDTLVVLENDLYRRGPANEITRLLNGRAQVIVLDHYLHQAARQSDLILPVGTFAETQGTLVSSEGRAQRHFAVHLPKDDIRASWEWLSDMIALRKGLTHGPWQHVDEVTQGCEAAVIALQGIVAAAPGEDFRISGQKVNRQPHRYSGRTAMHADVNVSELQQPQDTDSALAFTMEGYAIAKPSLRPAALTPYYWSPGWNSNQAVSKFQQKINGPLQGGDPGVRLIEPITESDVKRIKRWFAVDLVDAIAAVAANTSNQTVTSSDDFLLLPRHSIFASEELSARSSSVIERSPVPCALLHPDDAKQLAVTNTDGVIIDCTDRSFHLEVIVDEYCPRGAVCVPVGLDHTAGLEYLTMVKVSKDPQWQRRLETTFIATDKHTVTQAGSQLGNGQETQL